MNVLTWNVNRANERRPTWEFFKRENPDVALLQEVGQLPPWIRELYYCHKVTPMYFGGYHAKFSTMVLSKWPLNTKPFLRSSLDWVNRIQEEQYGWIVECEATINNEEKLILVSVHSPAFAIPKALLKEVDVSAVKLTNNPDVWFTEVLWSLLRDANLNENSNWLVGGDFNSSVYFDEPKDRGNRQFIERMNELGLVDCLSHYQGKTVPTFRHARGSVDHQLDYCYASGTMTRRLISATVPDQRAVFEHVPRKLSDHLPIICTFR